MANEKLRQAVIWARESGGAPLTVAAMARLLEIKRTTYDSYEKGKAEPPFEVLVRIGTKRALPHDWWRNFEPKQVDAGKPNQKRRGGAESVPLISVPSIGFLTRGSIRDQNMLELHEPVSLPANMVRPEYIIALADLNDSGLLFPHGCPLLFDPTKNAIVGQKVAAKLRDGTSSLREMAWDTDHIIYRSFNGKPDLLEHEVTIDGLLVGVVPSNKPGKFSANYDEDGL